MADLMIPPAFGRVYKFGILQTKFAVLANGRPDFHGRPNAGTLAYNRHTVD